MSFSINTNVTSLQAQNYLTQSSNFQAQTINQVTSGLRIVNSGDDAAGLAVANGLASDQAVLTQGIQNANNGLTTLQTIDGGMSNINTLLDRAQTLAAESASGTFTGNRGTLNTEFQSVLTEVNRQAQAIGLNTGGQFAKALSVYIGGGNGSTSAAAAANGTINIDLSKSAVDSQSLGLSGMQAGAATGTDLSNASATSVSNIVSDANNQASEAVNGTTQFTLSGSGFSGANGVKLSVNLNGVTDMNSLVTAVNNAIQSAGNGGTTAATSFKNANVVASVVTSSTGQQSLAFNSSSTAFQVQANDKTANALMGNFTTQAQIAGTNTTAGVDTSTNHTLSIAFNGGSAATYTLDASAINASGGTTSISAIAKDLNSQSSFSALGTAYVDSANHLIIQSNKTGTTSSVQFSSTSLATSLGMSTSLTGISDTVQGQNVSGTVSGAAASASAGTSGATAGNIIVRFQGSGLASPVDIKLSVTGGTTTNQAVIAQLQTAVQNNSALQAAGIKVGSNFSAGNTLSFTNSNNQLMSVETAGDNTNILGFGTYQLANASTATSLDYNTITAGAATASGSASLDFSVGGGQKFTVAATMTGTIATDVSALNAQFALSSQATAAGLQAVDNSGKLEITSSNGSNFRVNETDSSAFAGFGTAASNTSSLGQAVSTGTIGSAGYDAGGAQASTALSFSALTLGSDSQTVNLSSTDASGGSHTLAVDLSASNAGSIDAAISTINTKLQQSNDSTLQNIVAVKENNGGQEQIKFMSTNAFQVTPGATASGNGIGSQGSYNASTQVGTGANADISTAAGAQAAIGALTNAVALFGTAQAAVGRGENNLNYAVNLAQSQVTNEAAAESSIKDANLAAEAANLSKAQILVQAGTAALAQANSAPQQLLSLLQGH